ncbi:Serine protease, subtilisin family [Lachnospiraceae bacterium]|nr:Serine protease, subtilisin family [Lachnospiraceae bacterium]
MRRSDFRKAAAVVLSAVMVFTMSGAVFAAESVLVMEDRLDDASAKMKASLSEIDMLTEGNDYESERVFFKAGSQSEAQIVADAYNSSVVEFHDGVAVAETDDSVRDTLEKAINDRVSPVPVYPDLLREIDDRSAIYGTCQETVDWLGMDPFYAAEYQWFHDSIFTPDAWTASEGEGIKVAVLDTGADMDHEDLWGSIIGNYNVLDPESDADDTNGHGTHIAGLIGAARSNGYGGVGAAPKAGLYIIKVARTERVRISDEIAGIYHAIDAGVDVINMSFGSENTSEAEEDAIDEALAAGIVVVAAAGDDADDTEHYPAAYEGVISVASSTSYYTLSSFSDYGDWVDITAPGGDFYTEEGKKVETQQEWKANGILSCYKNNDYVWMTGSGQAAALVSAAAALLLSYDPAVRSLEGEARGETVRDAVLDTANDIEYGRDEIFVEGGLDAAELLGVEENDDEKDNDDEEFEEEEEEEDPSTVTAGQKIDITYLFEGVKTNGKVRYRTNDLKIARINKKGVLFPKKTGSVCVSMDEKISGVWNTVSSANVNVEVPVVIKKYEIDMDTVSLNGLTDINANTFVTETTRKPYWVSSNDYKLYVDNETGLIEVEPFARGTVKLYAVFGASDTDDREGTRKKYKVKIKLKTIN